MNTFSIKFDSILGELETLLNKSSQFTNTATLFTENVLSVCGTDDDSMNQLVSLLYYFFYFAVPNTLSSTIDTLLSTGRGNADFDTSVTVFSEFTSKEFVQFGVEDTIGDLQSCIVNIYWN